MITLPELNLPAIVPQLTRDGDQVFVFDVLRKKNILLTPEEWVRQHWIHFLITSQTFPQRLDKCGARIGLQWPAKAD